MHNNLHEAAITETSTRGRSIKEHPPSLRSEFQRDRDRIIHSASFRRLEYKTQVFVNHEGDMFRTRLTHSLEVSQISRTIARALKLNEDLTESIALAHDLGHSPFGHAGQRALNECMREFGGFEHNLQSLRVVDTLENRYVRFRGLNLLYETREGILKHCSIANAKRLKSAGDSLGDRFLNRQEPCLEAQIADVADEIAYNHHDIDDGIRSGLLTVEQLAELDPFRQMLDEFEREPFSGSDSDLPSIRRHTVIRKMINRFVMDLVSESKSRLNTVAPISPDEVRQAGRRLIGLSRDIEDEHKTIKSFLRVNLYHHPQVVDRAEAAVALLKKLFTEYYSNLPEQELFNGTEQTEEPAHRTRAIADYIAGMTDRFAIQECRKLFGNNDPALNMLIPNQSN